MGFELMTSGLGLSEVYTKYLVRRSTDWANRVNGVTNASRVIVMS